MNSMNEIANHLCAEITEKTERTIFQQFIKLIRDGVIEIKKTQPVVTVLQSPMRPDPELRMSEYVELTYKGEEVIEELKRRIHELEGKLLAIKTAVKGVGE